MVSIDDSRLLEFCGVHKLDPDVERLLHRFVLAGRPSLHTLTPEQARANTRALMDLRGNSVAVGSVENTMLPGPAGKIPIRIYRPAGKGPFPLLIYYHGGGWVLCDLDTHDNTCRIFCALAQCVTVSVDYRLAPEHKFPAAVDDCYAALEYLAKDAIQMGADPLRLAVGGDSAGGNLAAVVAQLARDRGGPVLSHQLLLYPIMDTLSFNTMSYKKFAKGYFLEKAGMEWFCEHYLNDPSDAADPRTSPLLSKDLTRLPAAQIATAGFDPLRDEGAAYARRLKEAGIPVDYICYGEIIHGFAGMVGVIPSAKKAMAEIAERLRQALCK
ncbi:MAG: hypothetical protein CMN58_00265 [Solibacterales bacterium]|nr:hypothetical protein [Bryobacterales bacterium]|tara:strand:- start:26048 stop:27028 length:981 start_codon:yes stop_codon:yes gene_type:complete